MSGLEDTDGLCGWIPLNSCHDQQVRCKYKFGHEGPHSYEATAVHTIFGSVYTHPVEKYTQKKRQPTWKP